MEESILGIEARIEEMHYLVKANVKSEIPNIPHPETQEHYEKTKPKNIKK